MPNGGPPGGFDVHPRSNRASRAKSLCLAGNRGYGVASHFQKYEVCFAIDRGQRPSPKPTDPKRRLFRQTAQIIVARHPSRPILPQH